jgi:hypothetical protein
MSTCSKWPFPGRKCLHGISALCANGVITTNRHVPKDIVVHFLPTGDAAVAHPKVDEIPRVLPERPRTFKVSRYSKSEVGGNADRILVCQSLPSRLSHDAHRSGCMLTKSIPTTFWTVNHPGPPREGFDISTSALGYLLRVQTS